LADSVEKIADMVPRDIVAWHSVFGEFVHWRPSVKNEARHYDAPPVRTRKFQGHAHDDMTATSFGRFHVIGYLPKNKTTRPHGVWLVRCRCGQYEVRNTKACRNPLNNRDRCKACRVLVHIRREEYFCRTGRQMPDEDAYA
jgi:hypothetical protein